MPKGCYHSDSSLQKKRSHWLLDSFSGGKRNPSIPIYPHVSLGIPMDPQVSLGIPREPQGSLRIPNRDPWGTLGSPGDPQRDPWRPPGIPQDPRAATGPPEGPEEPPLPRGLPRNRARHRVRPTPRREPTGHTRRGTPPKNLPGAPQDHPDKRRTHPGSPPRSVFRKWFSKCAH